MQPLDKKHIELINKEIDHMTTPDESAELQKFLQANKAAKDYFNDLQLTNDYLDRLPDHEPSENLKKQIINSINFNRYSLKSKKHYPWDFLFSPKLKIAYTFAFGLIIGIIIYALLVNNSNSLNINDVYGTIGINNDGTSTISELPLNLSDISGNIEIKGINKDFWFDLDLTSREGFDVVISYPAAVKFQKVRMGVAKNIELSKEQNSIKTTNSSGSQKYSLLFTRNSPDPVTVKIKILRSGNTLFEHKLTIKQ
jgi:hypothetical protein